MCPNGVYFRKLNLFSLWHAFICKKWTCGNYVHGDVFVHDIGRNMFCVVGEFEGYFFFRERCGLLIVHGVVWKYVVCVPISVFHEELCEEGL